MIGVWPNVNAGPKGLERPSAGRIMASRVYIVKYFRDYL
jgi:hypothetical protein